MNFSSGPRCNRERTTSLNLTGPGGVIASYSQSYGFSGRKQSVTEGSGRTVNYMYDPIYRLTNEAIAGDPVGVNGTLGYLFDPVANRQSLTSTLAALPSQSLNYDANDRLNSDTYDANGNTVTSGGNTYGYDFEDRLTTTSSGVQVAYDGDGNRVSQTVSGTTTKFLVDELTPTGYAQVAEELVNSGVTVQYTHGVMRIGQRRSGVLSYYGYDPGGSVRQLMDVAGAVTNSYSYDAFGNTIGRTGTTLNPYQYRSELSDAALGVYYLRARYFVPKSGRFLTRDTYEGRIMRPLTQHAFRYVNADPVNLSDPSGMNSVETSVTFTNHGAIHFESYAAQGLVLGSQAEIEALIAEEAASYVAAEEAIAIGAPMDVPVIFEGVRWYYRMFLVSAVELKITTYFVPGWGR